ncbi:MAG: amino acid-binding protein [bacterium]
MKMKQLSVFLENKPGRLIQPCKALADAGIDVLTMCMADTEKFGILRLIVKDWQRAQKILEMAGCVVNVTDVLAIEVPDKPGGLMGIPTLLEPGCLNIEYMYACNLKSGMNAVMIVRFDDPDRAIKVLHENGVNVLKTISF